MNLNDLKRVSIFSPKTIVPIVGIGTTSTPYPLTVTGTVGATTFYGANGAVGGPTFSFTSDPDTGMYNVASNELAFTTAGANRLYIGNSGRIGVGTTSPNRILEVAGPVRISPAALPGTPAAGDMAIDSGAGNSLKYHNGSNWISLAVGGTGDFMADGSVAMTGAFRSVAGTAATPGMTFVGDTDNGIFAPAADNLAFGTSAAERMRISASGFVGIGTTSPGSPLDVNGLINAQGYYAGVGSAAGPSFSFGSSGSTTGMFRPAANSLGLSSNGVERLRINSSGNVGIGTTSPTRLFEVAGPVRIAPAALPGSPGAGDLAFDSGASNSLKYHNGANWVSIGSGTGDFMADGTVNMTGTLKHLAGTAAAPGMTFAGDTDNGIFAPAADNLAFGTSAAERMRILPSGFIGMGTTNPTSNLNVHGSSTGAYGFSSPAPGGTSISITNDHPANNSVVSLKLVPTNGNGEMNHAFISAVANSGVYSPTITFGQRTALSGSTERMRIDQTGNVGIGNTNPARLLDVAGPIRIAATALPGSPAAGDLAIDSGAGNSLKFHNGSNWVALGSGSGDFMANGSVPMTGAFRSIAGNATAPGITIDGDTNTGIFAPAADQLAIGTSGLERLRVIANGNVGIGTTSPTQSLDVLGNGRLTETTAANNIQNALIINRENTGGIGSTGLGGRILFTGESSSTPSRSMASIESFWTNATDATRESALTFSTIPTGNGSTAERMRIDHNGNVGIGVTSPTRLLQVAGAMKINPTTNPGTPTAGDIFVDSAASNALKYHNGSSWVSIGSGTGDFMADGSVNMTGTLKHLAGNAAAPGLTFAGDTNTGIFAPAADQIAIGTSGAEHLRVLANGFVGIGITNPTDKLHVDGSATVSGGLTVGPITSSNVTVMGNGTAAIPAYGFIYNSGSGVFSPGANLMALSTNSVERLRIDGSGNIGIGTTSPTRLLQVAGAIKINPTANPGTPTAGDIFVDSSASNALKYHNGSTWVSVGSGSGDLLNGGNNGAVVVGSNDSTLSLEANNSVALTVLASGNVGIGTTNPNSPLHVSGNSGGSVRQTVENINNALNSSAGVRFMSGSSITTGYLDGIYQSPTNGSLAFSTLGLGSVVSERMRIDNSGNVGVGLTSPQANVHVHSPSPVITRMQLSNSNTGSGASDGAIITMGSDSALRMLNAENNIFALGTNGADRVTILGNGNVGIGTSTANRLLEVAGPVRIAPATVPGSPAAGDLFIDSAASNTLKYHNGSSWQTLAGGGATNIDGLTDAKADYPNGNIFIGSSVGGSGTGTSNTAMGKDALIALGVATDSTAVGANAMKAVTSGAANTALGSNAMMLMSTGGSNVAIGANAMRDGTGGSNTFVGGSAGLTATGSNNTVLGWGAGANGTYSGSVMVGYGSGNGITTGTNNQFFGYLAGGSVTSGSRNVVLGYDSEPPSATGSDQLSIGNIIYGTGVNGTGGTISTGNIGIGISAPTRRLHVAGAIKINPTANPGTPTAGDIFVDSSASNALKYHNGSNWVSVGSGSGDLLNGGNNGAVVVGSNDSTLSLEANNSVAMTVLAGGNVGVGTTSPSARMQVNGAPGARSFVSTDATNSTGFISHPSAGILGFGADTGSAVALYTNNTEKVRIDTSGNVGIGTTNPATPLHVERSQNSLSSIYSSNLSTGTSASAGIGVGNNSGITTYLNMTSSTYSGAGGTWVANGGGLISEGAGGLAIAAEHGSGTVRFYSAGTVAANERMRITSGGNVGIGTSSPTRLLQVAGAMKITPTANPGTPTAGDIFVDSSASNALKYHNGSNWVSIGSGTGDFMADGSVNMTGTLKHLAGTAAAPGMTFAGDTDNGIFAPAADNLAFGTSASEKMRILANGNVGIGTTAPSLLLHLKDVNDEYGFGSGYAHLRGPGMTMYLSNTTLFPTSGSTLGSVRFTTSGSMAGVNTGGASLRSVTTQNWAGGTQGARLEFLTTPNGSSAPSVAMTVDQSGNVGIGTTSPTRQLQVAGAMKINPTSNPGSPTAGDIFVDSSASNALKYHNGSNWVSIGSGTGDFMADGSVNMTGTLKHLAGTAAAPGMTFAGDVQNGIFAPATNTFAVSTNGAERLRINSSGNVAIGHTNPATALDLLGTMRMRSTAFGNFETRYMNTSFADNASTQPRFLIATDNATPDISFYSAGGRFYFHGANVGFGTTSPTRQIQVAGAMKLSPVVTPGTPTAGDIFVDSAASNTLKYHNGSAWVSVGAGGTSSGIAGAMQFSNGSSGFNADASNLFWADGTNRLGIGTSAPAESLHVNGTALIEGQFMTNNNIFSTGADFVNFGMENTSASYYQIANGTTPVLRIPTGISSGAGNVGIGTTNPLSRLHVEVNVNDDETVLIKNTNTGTSASAETRYDNNAWTTFVGQAGTNHSDLTFQNRGYVNAYGPNGLTLAAQSAGGSPDIRFYAGVAPAGERMRLTSGGNLGIGVTTPTRSLHLVGAMKITPTANPGTPTAGDIFVDSSASNTLKYHNGSAWVSVGAGGSSSGIAGAIQFSNGSSGFNSDASNIFYDDAANELGIGTSAPAAPLHIVGNAAWPNSTMIINNGGYSHNLITTGTTDGTDNKDITINGGGGPGNGRGSDIVLSGNESGYNGNLHLSAGANLTNVTTGKIALFTNGAERMSLTNAGFLGLGTTNPSHVLNVAVNAAGTQEVMSLRNEAAYASGTGASLRFDGQSYAGMALISAKWSAANNDNSYLTFETRASDSMAERVRIMPNGNVGIGTSTPARILATSGAIRITPTANPGSPGAGDIYIDSSASNALTYHNGSAWVSLTGGGSGDFLRNGTLAMTGNFNAGGFRVVGSSTASGDLYLESTSNATKGHIYLSPQPLGAGPGWVGIGTTNPTDAVHIVQNSTGNTAALKIENAATGSTSHAKLFLSSNAGNSVVEYNGNGHGIAWTSGALISDSSFRWNGTSGAPGMGNIDDKMTLTSTGFLGIGTTAPARRLHTAGAIRINPSANPGGNNAGDIFIDSTAANALKYNNGSAWVTVGAGGGGLPAADGTVGTPSINFTNSTGMGFYRIGANILGVSTAGVNRMAIDASGRVGIGTTTPSSLLDVRGGDIIQWGNGFQYKLKGSGGADRVSIGNNAGTNGTLSLFNNSDVKTVDITGNGVSFFNGGNVGIGLTAPQAKLDVRGAVTIGSTNTNTPNANSLLTLTSGGNPHLILEKNLFNVGGIAADSNHLVFAAETGGFTFRTGVNYLGDYTTTGTERVRISSTGLVGIGMTNPSVALDVTGDIEYTGTITDVSDARLKENVQPIESGLDMIRQLPVYSYHMKDDAKKKTEYGVMAQDLRVLVPNLTSIIDQEKGYIGVNYIGLIPWSIRAIQEVDREVASVKAENATLKTRLDKLEEQNKILTEQVQKLIELHQKSGQK